jgi:glycosyltransferase involved in cell wall biosynthesis
MNSLTAQLRFEGETDGSNSDGVAASPTRVQPVRLLVISSDTYPPMRVDVTVLFGEELAQRGHQIDWLLQSEQSCQHAHEIAWGNGRILVGPTDVRDSLLHRVRKHILGILHDFSVFSLLRNGSYDAVEVKDKFVSGAFALMAAKLYRKRFIFWLSYPFAEEYLLRARDGTARYPMLYRIRGLAFKVLLYRLLLPHADHVFVQSEQMKRNIIEEGIDAAKMTPVPMGIRQSGAPPRVTREARRIFSKTEPVILYLGTLSKVRRLGFLIRALALVRAHVPEARLYLIGRGDAADDQSLLVEEAAKLGLSDAVVFVGPLPQPEAFQYVAEADVCVSPLFPNPILNAGTPTKVVEYMAAGKPIVANDHPDQRQLLDESGAGFCVPYEEAAFANAIVKLLQSADLAEAMGGRGPAYVAKHRSYKTIADSVEAQLCRTIQRDGNP